MSSDSQQPVPDRAEHNAFFPSEFSLGEYVPPQTDFDGTEHDGAVAGSGKRILVIQTDERYLQMKNGTLFSTGNHPVETLLPLVHLDAAGFEIDVATPSGNLAKFELWAMPAKDEAVQQAYDKLLPQVLEPKNLAEVADELGPDSDYLAVFVPGGHGAMIDLADNPDVGRVLGWALDEDRFVITLCHGPAALLAANDASGTSRFAGYTTCAFPDALDTGANVDIGYIPGPMPWLLGEALVAKGLKLANEEMTGAVHQDRNLLTGDSPLAANALGKLSADVLTAYVKDGKSA